MMSIGARQAVVTAEEYDREPSVAELAVIEREMPLITAEIDLLDAQIIVLDRTPTELDARRLRRARRRVLAERLALANRSATSILPGGAA